MFKSVSHILFPGFGRGFWHLMIRHKFNSVRCEEDGIKFSSKAERAYYLQLKARQRLGEVIFFLMQTRFDLPGGVRHVIDFTVFLSDGTVEFVDTKGFDTPMGKLKRKMVEDLYPVKIKVEMKK